MKLTRKMQVSFWITYEGEAPPTTLQATLESACVSEYSNPLDVILDLVRDEMPDMDNVCAGVLPITE